jgi:hypothetical protein
MNKCLTISSRFIQVCTTKTTSIDSELFSSFYCSDHSDYSDRSEMTFYSHCCSDHVLRNFNTSLKVDSCRCRIYHHDFLCRVLYNFLCRDRRLDHYSELRFETRQSRVDRFDCKTEIDTTWRFRTSSTF